MESLQLLFDLDTPRFVSLAVIHRWGFVYFKMLLAVLVGHIGATREVLLKCRINDKLFSDRVSS